MFLQSFEYFLQPYFTQSDLYIAYLLCALRDIVSEKMSGFVQYEGLSLDSQGPWPFREERLNGFSSKGRDKVVFR